MRRSSETYIGFPSPLLGKTPQRLQLLEYFPGAFLLEKPTGVLPDEAPWYPHIPNLASALRIQLKLKKPELIRYCPENLIRSVFTLEPEVSGAVLFATTQKQTAALRNAVGSGAFKFIFHLLTLPRQKPETEFEVDLPLFEMNPEQRMRVSHSLGKKAHTTFRRLAILEQGYQLWEASATYMRMHQIRLHAEEAGLHILGECKYSETPMLTLRNFKRGYLKGADAMLPLYEGMGMHLAAFTAPLGPEGEVITISIPWPKSIQGLLRFLRVGETLE